MKFLKLSPFLLIIFAISCNQNEVATTTVNNQASSKLKADDYFFARKANGSTDRIAQPVYKRGETVYFVLKNVGQLTLGENNKHHVEIRMKVENYIGEVISSNTNLLNKKGIRNFKNNQLKTPNASYTTTEQDQPGKYTFSITLVDFIANDSLVVSSQFILE